MSDIYGGMFRVLDVKAYSPPLTDARVGAQHGVEVIKTALLENLDLEKGTIPRKKKLDARYSSQCQSTLKRLACVPQEIFLFVGREPFCSRPAGLMPSTSMATWSENE
jgi:hypothetical protein